MQTQQMAFLSAFCLLWEWGKLKIGDAFQKAHSTLPSAFHTVHLLSDVWGGPPGHGNHYLTPAF